MEPWEAGSGYHGSPVCTSRGGAVGTAPRSCREGGTALRRRRQPINLLQTSRGGRTGPTSALEGAAETPGGSGGGFMFSFTMGGSTKFDFQQEVKKTEMLTSTDVNSDAFILKKRLFLFSRNSNSFLY